MNQIIRPRQIDYSKTFTKILKVEDFYKIDGGLNQILEKSINISQNTPAPNQEQQITPSTTTVSQKKKNQKEQEKFQQQQEKNNLNLNQSEKDDKTNQVQKQNNGNKPYEQIIIPELMVLSKKQQQEAEGGLLQKRKSGMEYIKIMKNQKNLPDNEAYELTNKDCEFLKKIKKVESLDEIQQSEIVNFEKYFEIFEDEQDKKLIEKNELISLQQAKNAILERLQPVFRTYDTEQMYKYWESLRKQFKRELIRKFYKTSADNTDPQLAFRPRQKTKTRRVTRALGTTSYNKMVQLKTELVQACNILTLMKHREQMKTFMIECQNLQFDEQIKQDKNDGAQNQQKWSNLFSLIKKEQETLKKKKKIQKVVVPAPQVNTPSVEQQPQPQIPQPQVKPPVTQYNSENKSFDIAAFLASIILEADKLELTQTNIKDLDSLNKFHKKFLAKKQSQNQSPQKTTIQTATSASPVKQPSQSMINKINDRQQIQQLNQFQQQQQPPYPMQYQNFPNQQAPIYQPQGPPVVTSKLIQYKMHKRLARSNRIIIDRFLLDDDIHTSQIEHQKLNQKVKLIKISTCQIHPSPIEEEDDYDENDDIYSADTAASGGITNNMPANTLNINQPQNSTFLVGDQNDLIKQKHIRFSSLYCFSDSEDESAKQIEIQDQNLKKQIRNSFLNFLKVKRKQRQQTQSSNTNINSLSNALQLQQQQSSSANFENSNSLIIQPEFSNQQNELITTNS